MELRIPARLCSTVLLVVGVAATALLSGCSGHATNEATVRPAIVAQPTSAVGQNLSTYAGEVRARYESSLGFRINGKVSKRLVDVGSEVKKGAILASLEPQDNELAVTSARAVLASAEADWALANSEFDRYRQMYDKKLIGKSTLDARESALKASAARVDQAKAALAASQNQSSYTTLRADSDGVITQTLIEAGQVVAAGTPVVMLAHTGEREVLINVPENRINAFKPGQPVLVEIWANRGSRLTGVVREVAPEADRLSRTFNVRVTLKEGNDQTDLGMTARVYLGNESDRADALLVPLASLTEINGKPAVWLVDGKTHQVHSTPIEVGGYGEAGVTVLSGLTPTAWVVSAGAHKLADGERIRPIDRDNKEVTL